MMAMMVGGCGLVPVPYVSMARQTVNEPGSISSLINVCAAGFWSCCDVGDPETKEWLPWSGVCDVRKLTEFPTQNTIINVITAVCPLRFCLCPFSGTSSRRWRKRRTPLDPARQAASERLVCAKLDSNIVHIAERQNLCLY